MAEGTDGATAVVETGTQDATQTAETGTAASNGTTTSTTPTRSETGQFAKPEDLAPIDWRASLPPEYQKDGTVQAHKTLHDFVKSALETKAFVGRSLQLPHDEADAEGWGKVFEKLGRPKDAASYTVTPPTLPEGVGWDGEMERQFREEAHAAGLTQKQMDAMVAFEGRRWQWLANQVQATEAEEIHAAKQSLMGEFGAAYPRLEQAAMHVLELWGQGVWGGERGQKAVEKLKAKGAFQDADVIASLANLYEKMREGDYLTNDTYPAGMSTTGDIDTQIQTLMKEKMDAATGVWTPAKQKQLSSLYELKARFAEQGR
jgi:hypothetical protein